MKKFLGFLFKLLLLAILVVVLYAARNIYIYTDLGGKISKYEKKNVVHTKTSIEACGEYQIFNVYQRGTKQVAVVKVITLDEEKDEINVSTFYHDVKGENNIDVYINTKDGKTKLENSSVVIPVRKPVIQDFDYTKNVGMFFRYVFARINSVNCDGEEAYQIRFLNDKDHFMIVSKTTGLTLQEKNGTKTKDDKTEDIIQKYEYEFDEVTQDMVDINTYIDVNEYLGTENTSAKTDGTEELPPEDNTNNTDNTTNTISNTVSNTTNNAADNTQNVVSNTTVTNKTEPNRVDSSENPNADKKEKLGESSFVAVVGKKYSTSMLVEGTDENSDNYYKQEFSVAITDDVKFTLGSFSAKYDEVKVGDKVKVYYNNGVLETKPARIQDVTVIEIIK